ncbi:MAG: RnfABCDGE type electron transport complex subunit B [Lachnospiraceae bacterium]|nr:RnfABCDGE type electron transport complex subunit B [Lachnospiraceae bacterium]
MDIMTIVISAALIGGVALLVGLLLGIAGNFFRVEVDERELAVREALPGNNCGGCGYPGCDGLAKAIAAGEASVGACPVGGAAVAEAISSIMGVSAGKTVRQVAFVKCGGTCDKASYKGNYFGVQDCKKAAVAPGQSGKACSFGCMGLGTCVRTCPFDAIHVENGIAVVDKEKCTACGRCVAACPLELIELVPYEAEAAVGCHSTEKGKDVKAVCEAGCIGCGICAKNCPDGAIIVENNLAHIDQSKCTGCGTCVEKCPTGAIKRL